MAIEEIKRMISLLAGENLSSYQHYCVKLSAANTVVRCGLGEKPLGILDNAPASGGSAAVAVSGRLRIAAGAAISAGQIVMSDATGRAIPALDREGWVLGEATDAAAAAGAEVSVAMAPHYQQKGIQQYIAGENLTAAAGLLAKVGATAGRVIKATVAGEQVLGVIKTGATTSGVALVKTSGRTTVKSGAAFTLGDRLMADASAKAVKATSFGGERIFGIALATATGADEDIDVLLVPAEVFGQDRSEVLVAGAGGTTENCLVSADTTDGQVVLPALGGACIGVALATALAAASVRVQISGIATVKSAAALTAGDRLESDAAGKVQTYNGAANRKVCGVALSSAANPDEDVEVLLVGPGGWEQDITDYTLVAAAGGVTTKLILKAGAVDGEAELCGSGETALGVALNSALAGADVAIRFIGQATVTSGGAVNAGQLIECDAASKAIVYTGTADHHAIGVALSTVAGPNLDLEVMILPFGWEQDIPSQLEFASIAGIGGTTEHLLVVQSATDGKVVIAGSGSSAIGVAKSTAILDAPVQVQFAGVAEVTTGAAVTAGNLLESDAAGACVPYTGTADHHVIGVALEAAVGAGVEINVLLIGPAGWEQDLPNQLQTSLTAEAGGLTEKLFASAHTVDGQAVQSGLGDCAIGVAQSTVAGGAACNIRFAGRVTVTSGAAVNAGELIQSNAAGKAIAADGVEGHYVLGVALDSVIGADADLDVLLISRYPQEAASYTQLFNDLLPIDVAWTPATNGSYELVANNANKVLLCRLPGLQIGQKIETFRLVGSLGASAGNHTVVDADLRRNMKQAGTVSDSLIDSIATVDVQADTALDAEETIGGGPETVAADCQYYVRITVSTANDPTCDAAVIGVELDFVR